MNKRFMIIAALTSAGININGSQLMQRMQCTRFAKTSNLLAPQKLAPLCSLMHFAKKPSTNNFGITAQRFYRSLFAQRPPMTRIATGCAISLYSQSKRAIASESGNPESSDHAIKLAHSMSTSIQSSTVCLHPILKTLYGAAAYIQKENGQASDSTKPWHAVNPTQALFLQNYFVKKNDLTFFNQQELRAWCSRDHNFLNEILRKENFSIQLQPFGQRDFGVVSILDVIVEWLNAGQKSIIHKKEGHGTKEYAAVKMNEGFTIHKSTQHSHPVACIKIKSGDLVWMTVADKPLESFDLDQRMASIMKSTTEQGNYEFVKFPMVDLDQEVNIKWLLNMKDSTGDWFISQALQQTKFKMNEKGARVKSAVAIAGALKSCRPQRENITIDQPFYLCVTRPGVELPILTAYITEKNWKDPKNLTM